MNTKPGYNINIGNLYWKNNIKYYINILQSMSGGKLAIKKYFCKGDDRKTNIHCNCYRS